MVSEESTNVDVMSDCYVFMSYTRLFGHFKIWHAAGSVLVAVSFSSVFGGCVPCKVFGTSSSTLETVGYSLFAAIFNVGWAATQVSHMSMVNCITLNSTSRVVLTSCRNAFTMIANLSLYAVALIVFAVTKANTYADFENQYRWIVYSSIFIGCCSVGIFLFGTKEPRSRVGAQGNFHVRIAWAYWIKRVPYYEVAIVYVLTRLVVNVSQEIAWTGQCLKAYYSVGGIIWIFSGAAIVFLPRSMSAFMYIISIFIGVANALMMV
nr:major facilitator superfamily domain-containing protein 12 [Quercus suber]